MRFNHVAIVGLGLIGGSFALALRRAGLASRITGWNGGDSLDAAIAGRVIDGIEDSFYKESQCDADLIYLAAPVEAISGFLRRYGRLVKPGALVTDAGSTKREICAAARAGLRPESHFVGGHPMAGSHLTGVEFADAALFQNAPYAVVVEPIEDADGRQADAASQVARIAKAIGARPVMLDPLTHDRIAAQLSHAPQLLSTALAAAVDACGDACELGSLAGSGFHSMTRLAESRWSVWDGICRTNRDQIIGALTIVARELDAIRAALDNENYTSIGERFRRANDCIRRINESRNERS
jgi:prephenate dehydrogenase